MSKHTPVAQQRRLVAAWRRSAHSKSAFARSHGVATNTFWRCTQKYPADEVALTPPPSFMDVTPEPDVEPLRVRLGVSGQLVCELDFDTPPPPSWFAAVLQGVTSC